MTRTAGAGLVILSHTLPETLLPGQRYPIDLLLKNGSLPDGARDSTCQVNYHVLRTGQNVFSGTLDGRLLLHAGALTRLRFTLATQRDDHRYLADGHYTLQLDFWSNKVPLLNSKLLRDKLGTLVLSFSIGRPDDPGEVIASDVPVCMPVQGTGAAAIIVRNTTRSPWRKGTVGIRFRWTREDGFPLPGETQAGCEQTLEPGDTGLIRDAVPPAPAVDGWYCLVADLLGKEENPAPLYCALAHVTAIDLQAEFRMIAFPRSIADLETPVQAQVLLHNRGLTAWTPAETRLTFQWLNWCGLPVPDAAGTVPLAEVVEPGGLIHLAFSLPPPPGAGSFRSCFGMEHAGQPMLLAANPTKFLLPQLTAAVQEAHFKPVNLLDACRVPGDGGERDTPRYARASGEGLGREAVDFDGAGRGFPLDEFLPDATLPPLGYQPGYLLGTPVIGSPGFVFCDLIDGQAVTARASGQVILLPERPAVTLHLVATATAAPQPADFVVRYTNGTEMRLPITVSNWLGDPLNHEPILLRSSHLHTRDGDDWTRHGTLFVYSLPLDPAHTPESLILPDAPAVALIAATLELADGNE